MSMTPEQAKFLLDHLTPALVSESKTTKKVIAAMPAGQEAYKPSEKCMSAGELAFHVASADVWFLNSIANGAFAEGGGPTEKPKTPAAILEWYDQNFGPALDKVKALSPEKLASNISFFGMMDGPAVGYLDFMIRHTVHHRGQLSSYLRPMGGKVPAIYGGSADEPMK